VWVKRGVVVVLAVMAMTTFADAASGATFQPGDLLLQRDLYDPDETRWLRADGSFVSTLTARGHLAFDAKGRLYSVETHASRVFAYDVDGTLLGTHIEIPGTCVDASGLTFDAVGNAYVGEFGGCVGEPKSAGVRKFDPNGNFVGFPFTRAREADLLDLASDQCTLYAMSRERQEHLQVERLHR
jgi:sugar lactone lactonase YvrE